MNTDDNRIADFIRKVELCPASESDPEFFYHRIFSNVSGSAVTFSLRYCGSFQDWQEQVSFVAKWLGRLDHVSNYETASALVALLVLQKSESRTEGFVSRTRKMVKGVKLKQYHLFHKLTPGTIHDFVFSTFRFGLIDFQKLKTFIENHVSSNFVDMHEVDLKNKVGIEVKVQDVLVLDISEYLKSISIALDDIPLHIADLINHYLANCARHYFAATMNSFEEHQDVASTMFGIHCDAFELRKFGIFSVPVFYGFGKSMERGWVLHLESVPHSVDMPDPRVLSESNRFAKSKEHLILTNRGEYSRFVHLVAKYFAGATRNIHKRKYNHALIDFFVGLDFLLAPDTEKSKKLKERIALLTYEKFGNELTAQVALMDRLYDSRSNFIHNGIDVTKDDLILLTNVCRTVFGCLLNMHERYLKNPKMSRDEWLRKIDCILAHFYTKNQLPTMKDRVEIGTAKLDFVQLITSFGKLDDAPLY